MSLLLTVHVTEIEWKFFIWLQATQKKCNELQWKIFSCWKNFLTCSHSVHKLSSLLLFFHVPFCSEHKLNLVHHVNSSWSNFFLCCRSRKTFVVYNICVSVKQSQIILLSCIFWVFLFLILFFADGSLKCRWFVDHEGEHFLLTSCHSLFIILRSIDISGIV